MQDNHKEMKVNIRERTKQQQKDAKLTQELSDLMQTQIKTTLRCREEEREETDYEFTATKRRKNMHRCKPQNI